MQHWIITRDPWHKLPHHTMYNLLLHCKIESYLEIHKKMIPMCHIMNLRARHCDARVLYLGSDKISVLRGQGLSSKLRSWIQKQIWQKFGQNWSEKSGDHSTACNLCWVSIVFMSHEPAALHFQSILDNFSSPWHGHIDWNSTTCKYCIAININQFSKVFC